jgi:hypothetical protein
LFIRFILFLWRNSPNRAQAAPVVRSLDYTQLDTQTVELLWTSDQPVAETTAYTTHNRRISMHAAGFEPVIPKIKRHETYPLDSIATGIYLLWRNSPNRAQAAPLLKSLDHTQLDTQSVGLLWTSDQPVAQAVTFTTHNQRKRQTSMPARGFEPRIPATQGPQTCALDRLFHFIVLTAVGLILTEYGQLQYVCFHGGGGHPVTQLAEALRYQTEGRGSFSRWCYWNVLLTQSLRPHCGPGVDSASNRNEYQGYFLG